VTARYKQFGEEYATIFRDASVVAAYKHRPPYPPATFEFLLQLIPEEVTERLVLDAGCGTGFIARPLARYVDHVDAVDVSKRMVETAKTLPGGDRPNITWIAAPIETAPLGGPYALVVTAASLHWMDWDRTLPRFASHLVSKGVLATVEESEPGNPWDHEVGPILARYSMNLDFEPFNETKVLAEIERRGLFRLHGSHETEAVPVRQSIDSWVESFHARNGFSRERMETEAAAAFDAEMRQVIRRYCPDGVVELPVGARILWGRPLGR
jgi:SAM-dependent methyltransferase